jgi:hypothetical protein
LEPLAIKLRQVRAQTFEYIGRLPLEGRLLAGKLFQLEQELRHEVMRGVVCGHGFHNPH